MSKKPAIPLDQMTDAIIEMHDAAGRLFGCDDWIGSAGDHCKGACFCGQLSGGPS